MTDSNARLDVDCGGDSAAHVITLLWKNKKILIAAAFMGGVFAIALSFLVQKQFSATATILPRFGAGESGLLAALGSFANLPVQGELSIEDLYPAILRSDQLLDRVITEDRQAGHLDVNLYGLLKVGGADSDSLLAARRLKKVLRERVLTFRRDRDSGVMGVSVTMPGSPVIAADMANLFTDELGRFVEDFNRNRTHGKLSYIQQRVDDVAEELAETETDLAGFLMENRAIDQSPQLKMAVGVKERQVQALTAVWIELVRQHEIAKMDDNEEMFSVEVLDRAVPPLNKTKPRRASMGVVGAFLVFVLGCVVIIVRDFNNDGFSLDQRAG